MSQTIDTSNDSVVAVNGKCIVVMGMKPILSREQALRLAAWIVALADEKDEFPALLEAVRNT
jgi:hypothetical protein